MLKDHKLNPASFSGKNVKALPNSPSASCITSAELKAAFDRGGEEVIANAFNASIDTLTSIEGAANIGTVGGSDVQSHINDKNNPHAVTALQVSAYTKAETDKQINERIIVIGAADMQQAVYDKSGKKLDIYEYADLKSVTLTHTKTATAHNLVGTLPTSGIISANFLATADFLANETFSVNSAVYTAKPNGEEPALPDKAFIAGDLVNITIDIGGKKLGFKLGGGNAKFNIFPQIEQPTAENGIWVKTNKEILNTIVTQFNDISAEGTWRNIAPSLDRRTESGGATIGSVIYCIGGASSAGICGLNQAYDTQTDMWSTKAPMPTARRELAVSSVGTNIYCNCGDFNSTLHKKNEVYDTQTNLWSTKVSVHGSLTSATSCAVGKIIYLLGGYTSGNINENQAYDTQTDMWSTKAPMPIGNASLAAVAVNSIIYAMGGVDNRTANYAYDTVSNLWSAKTTLSTGTYSAGACNIGTIVYLIGGYGTEYNNSAYDTITNLWSSKSQMKANRPSRPVVSAIGTNVYALCGETSGITAELYSLYGTTYPNKTMIVQQGEKFANKTKLFIDKKIVIDAYINQCYYHNGTTLEIVPSAINLNGMGWKNII